MNSLAVDLNTILKDTAAFELLSEFGKRFYFPKGIAAQSAEAKEKAKKHNATIGMAFADKEPMMVPSLRKFIPDLTPTEAVSYASNGGDAVLRKKWKEEIVRKNPGMGNSLTSLPMIVAGLTNGIAQLADLFTEAGTPVVVPDMFWGNYRLIFAERKLAEMSTFPFYSANGGFNVEGLRSGIKNSARDGKIILLLNFPNNPTGYSPTAAEAQQICDVIAESAANGIRSLVIIDDAYFGLFYESETFKESLFSKLVNIHENVVAVKVDGPTKEDFVWGFRIGFITFGSKELTAAHYGALEAKLLGAIRSSISNSSRPAQSLLLRAMQSQTYIQEKLDMFQQLKDRYLRVREIVNAQPDGGSLRPLPFNSGYFMSFECMKENAEEIRRSLLEEKGIGTISIQGKYLRVAYSSIELDKIEDLYREIFLTADKL